MGGRDRAVLLEAMLGGMDGLLLIVNVCWVFCLFVFCVLVVLGVLLFGCFVGLLVCWFVGLLVCWLFEL